MKLYKNILADPPWYWRNYAADAPGMTHERSRGAMRHYPCMTTDQICGLQAPAADDCVLFLWACWPNLKDAMQVIDAWGFEYKTLAWVWVKTNRNSMGFFTGMGYYTRANSEPCFLATRGKPGLPEDKGVQALIVSPVREHSRKPDEQYRKVESLYPNSTYLEMFARRKRDGWDAWGNQVENDVLIPNLSQA